MGYLLIGTNIKNNNRDATWSEVKNNALQAGSTVLGMGKLLNVERERFKLGNLDILMLLIDQLVKIESNTDSLIKRIEKQYHDLEEKKESRLVIETMAGQVELGKYVMDFKWDDSKFARNKPVTEVVKLVQVKVDDIDRQFRQTVQNYQEVKNSFSMLSKKEGGNFMTKDLNEVLVTTNVKASDFVETEYMTTLIAVVPKNLVEDWRLHYESLTDNVVPGSTKQFNVEDKDGLTLWRVILFRTQVQDFIKNAREKLKITVKEFKYNEEAIKNREKDKKVIEVQYKATLVKLEKVCQVCYSEAYTCFMHLKILKLLVDCAMRFGVNEPYLAVIIDVFPGKDKRIVQGLLKIFSDPSQLGLYGTKEELQESEDFYPFVYIPIGLN
eukprot:TRINITY_DN647_c0_g1_i1.p1 TRINITY_DN647_c0_g1~~TRINITY_DN647_c0_g1_i1.p1  ORF type:complete len:383 (+),score=120.89 TRINITY_DN647_c0_g1_i1:137-1285(+)